MSAERRLLHDDWDRYDTRHTVFRPARMSAEDLERGYRRAYRQFYTWRNIARGAAAHGNLLAGARHFAYASGWKKFEPLWDLVIRARQAGAMLPVLEAILDARRGRSLDLPASAAASHDVPLPTPHLIPLRAVAATSAASAAAASCITDASQVYAPTQASRTSVVKAGPSPASKVAISAAPTVA
jgi:hypothetical protein